jgi:hypothetical protein
MKRANLQHKRTKEEQSLRRFAAGGHQLIFDYVDEFSA